jgi:hypothetical protein
MDVLGQGTGAGGGGGVCALTSSCLLKGMCSDSNLPNIYTMLSFQTRRCCHVQQHKFRQKYDEAFYWVEQQHGFA